MPAGNVDEAYGLFGFKPAQNLLHGFFGINTCALTHVH
jgi:hypothetical protein